MRGFRFVLVTGVAVAMSLGAGTAVSGQENPLPDDVRSWMEQDQLRRWAMLIQTGDSGCSRIVNSSTTTTLYFAPSTRPLSSLPRSVV